MNERDFDGDRPRQLLVCTFGEDCARKLKERDGQPHALADVLKAERTAAGLKRQLYVTKTGCMGWCEHAPVMQLLPEGKIVPAPELAQAAAVIQACASGEVEAIWDYSLSREKNLARRRGD